MYVPHRTIPHHTAPGKIQYRTDGNSRILHVPTYFVLVIGVLPVNYPDPDPRFKHKISYGVLCMKWIGQIRVGEIVVYMYVGPDIGSVR